MRDADPATGLVTGARTHGGARLRCVAAAAMGLLCCLLFARMASAGDDVAAAEALLKAGKVQEAVDAFRKLADAPGGEAPEIQSGLGRALLAVGDPTGALNPLGTAAAKRGGASDHMAYANALLASVRERLAAGTQRSIDVTPYLKDAVLESAAAKTADASLAAGADRTSGEAKYLLGDLAGARESLSSATLSKDTYALDLLARACYQAGDFAAAADAWTAAGSVRGAASAWAAAKDARSTKAFLSLIEKAPGDWTIVEEGYRAARYANDLAAFDAGIARLVPAKDPPWPLVRVRGRVAEVQGKPADAVPYYKAVAAERPQDASAWSDLARVLLRAGPGDAVAEAESLAALRAALKADPLEPSAREELAWMAKRDADDAQKSWPDRTRLDRSIEITALLAETDPTDAVAWANLGNQRRVASDGAGSLEAYGKAVEVNPYDAPIASDRGLALLASGDEPGSLAQFEKAAEIDPGAVSPRQNAARLRWLRGDVDAAEAHYAAALKSSRTTGGKPLLFRFFLDRCWRSRHLPGAR